MKVNVRVHERNQIRSDQFISDLPYSPIKVQQHSGYSQIEGAGLIVREPLTVGRWVDRSSGIE